MLGPMRRSTLWVVGWLGVAACTSTPDSNPNTLTSNTFGPSSSESTASDESGSTGDESTTLDTSTSSDTTTDTTTTGSTTGIPDLPPVASGCVAVDLLFVIDNSESMGVYQEALADAFPSFIDALYDFLPPDVSLHVGVTTTDMAGGCSTPQVNAFCQGQELASVTTMYYSEPNSGVGNGVPGSQGRLFPFAGKTFFESNTSDDAGPLKTWFDGAATSAGENGCSFEMPIAAAGWAAAPINIGATGTNKDFFRNQGALLVVFFLTDEPDHTPIARAQMVDLLRGVKSNCGETSPDECIFMAGLVPACISESPTQNLWKFMNDWGHDTDAPWADILQVDQYETLVGETLANTLADECEKIPPEG